MPTAFQTTPNFKGSHLNVKMFQAVGDGITNDRAAIQSAIDSIAATSLTGSGWLHIPAGEYLLDARLLLPANVYLYGDGMNATILSQPTLPTLGSPLTNTATDYDVMTIQGGNSGLKDMTLLGGAGTSPAAALTADGAKVMCIEPVGGTLTPNFMIERVAFVGGQTNCVQVWTGASNATFVDCRFTDAGNEGIITFAAYTTLTRPYAARCQSWGVDFNFDHFTMTGFLIEDCGSLGPLFFDGGGIAMNPDPRWLGGSPASAYVSDGTIQNCIGVAMTVSVALVVNTFIKGINVSKVNVISTNRSNMNQAVSISTGGGAALGSTQNVKFSDCYFTNCNVGIQACKHIQFVGCTFENGLGLSGVDDFSTAGFYVDTGLPSTPDFGAISITNCTFIGWARGVNVHTCDNGFVSLGNTFHDNLVCGMSMESPTSVPSFTSTGDSGWDNVGLDLVCYPEASKVNGFTGTIGATGNMDITKSLHPSTSTTDIGNFAAPFRNMVAGGFFIDPAYLAGPYNAYYHGDPDVVGCWRFSRDNDHLTFQYLVSIGPSVWNDAVKIKITGIDGLNPSFVAATVTSTNADIEITAEGDVREVDLNIATTNILNPTITGDIKNWEMIIVQDATGGRAVAFGSDYIPSDLPGMLSTSPNTYSSLAFSQRSDGKSVLKRITTNLRVT